MMGGPARLILAVATDKSEPEALADFFRIAIIG
jgi:hypothetical protein